MYRIKIYLPDGTEITVLPPKDEPDARERWRKTVKEVRARLARKRQAEAESGGDDDRPKPAA